jgi:acyl carrier protein
MSNKLVEQVCGIAADVFGESPMSISVNTSQDNLANWDSIQHLNLVLALEDAFNIRISPEEAERAVKMSDVVGLVQAKLSVRS